MTCALAACGCTREAAPPDVVVYTSVDQQFAERILARFERETGIRVHPVFDTEAGKTTGLLRRLQQERARPRCDLWWSSEAFGTIELARQGVFQPYDSPAAADIPPQWKDPQHLWTGFAARCRVLAYRRAALQPEALPKTWIDLQDPAWASRLAVANPQFGTTRGHVAAMFALWGEDTAAAFLRKLADGGTLVTDGNSMAVRAVAAGEADVCMTDTDDVWVAQRRGLPVEMVHPVMTADGDPLWIPNTVALVRGGPNPDAARRLYDFLASAEVERALLESDSHNIPVRPGLQSLVDFESPRPVAPPFDKTADALARAMDVARETLLR